MTFVEEPVAILARDVGKLRSRVIPIVKVHWRHRSVEEATWETEQELESSFPACLSLQVLLGPYFRGRKFFLVVDIVMTLVIFSVLSSVHRLERSYSDSKSFMTCWD